MEGSRGDAEAGLGGNDRAAEADRLFARLTTAAAQASTSQQATAPPEALLTPRELPPSPRSERQQPGYEEMLELVRAIHAASDLTAQAVEAVASQIAAVAADLATMRDSVTQGLETNDERLAALERMLLVHQGPPGEPIERAISRLRTTLQQRREDTEPGIG